MATREMSECKQREQTFLPALQQQSNAIALRREKLAKLTPATFLAKYNATCGAVFVERGYTCGQLALRDDVPTLADVREKFGSETVSSWLSLMIFKSEETGALCLSTDARTSTELRRETAQMIWVHCKDLNLAEIAMFFQRFATGYYEEACRENHGAMKLYVALRAFSAARTADVRRLERELETRDYLAAVSERNERACSYEEYKKSIGK